MQRFLRISVVVTIAILVMLGGLMVGTGKAVASTNKITIGNQVQLMPDGSLQVQVSLICNLVFPDEFFVVRVSQGGTEGSVSNNFVCTRSEQHFTTTVSPISGSFQPGDATATATLFTETSRATDTRTVDIVQ